MAFFFIIVLAIYALLNVYVIGRGWQALAASGAVRWVFLALAAYGFLAFPLSRILARWVPPFVTIFMSWVGGFYAAAIITSLCLIILIDFFRLANALLHFFPRFVTANPGRAGAVAFWVVLGVVGASLAGGFLAAVYPRIRTVDLTLARKSSPLDHLNVVMVSDVHLSAIWRNAHLKKIVAKVNGLKPDLVLLPGDIVDMDISPTEEEAMIGTLKAIRAPMGVFAVTGNHEYYGGVAKNVAYLERGGVRVLQDEWTLVDGAFVLAGRKDLSANRMGDKRRTLAEILSTADRRYPVILMDHQPFHLEEAERQGVDLELSGHTHAGQLFPITIINKSMYEQNWGYWRRGRTQYYVSCGAGTWGIPVRTGSVSEIVDLRLTLR